MSARTERRRITAPKTSPSSRKRFLKIDRRRSRGDFVFLLGIRPHLPALHGELLDYEEAVRMPYVVDWYGRQIDLMEKRERETPL